MSWRSKQAGSARTSLIAVLLVSGLTALVLTWLTTGLIWADKWPIRWLDVNGPFERVSADQIRGALADEVDGGFFTVDLDRVRMLTEEIPWVSSAQARTHWPDTVEVRVREYQAVAHWGENALVSDQGEIFVVPAAAQIQGLPWLLGPQSRVEEVITFWRQAGKRLARLAVEVEDLRLHERGAWEVRLDNQTRVLLGREDLLPRLQRLVANWNQLTDSGRRVPRSIDLRYTNGFAVDWGENG